MRSIRSNQAIVAGLLSCDCLLAPHCALAASSSSNVYLTPDFGFGLLAGIGISGLIATISYFIMLLRDKTNDAPTQATHLRNNLSYNNVDEVHNLDEEDELDQLEPDTKSSLTNPDLRSLDNTFAYPQSSMAHASNDYADIAANYVQHQSFKERMAARAQGVAKILSERLSSDRFDDVPVIQRADGSVGDVGTSWWESRLGDSVRHVGDADSYRSITPVDFSQDPTWLDEEAMPHSSEIQTDSHTAEFNSNSARADYIRNSIAEVNEGAYPAQRSISELDHKDLWEVALHNMNEKISHADSVVHFDADFDDFTSVDEVDDMSSVTAFIPFKAPGNHPEVVDRDSYVDYLLEDEFSRNESKVARKSSHNYLKVLEGGSQTLPLHVNSLAASHNNTASIQRPKHMSTSPAKSCVFSPKHFVEPNIKEA